MNKSDNSMPMNGRRQTDYHCDTLVVGMGRTGLSCARYLHARGIEFAIVDSRSAPPGLEEFEHMMADVPVTVGGFEPDLFEAADCLVVSPGVSLDEPVVAQARRQGKVVLGDIEMFAGVVQSPVVAITGSNGKSTVTVLVGQMAEQAGLEVRVGGNLGPPALELIEANEPDLYVLELSSFQLETTRSLDAATSVVLNVSPDHMDRYGDLDEYAGAKQRVYRGTGIPVINKDDPATLQMVDSHRAPVMFTLGEPGDGEFGVRHHEGAQWLAFGDELLMPVSMLALKGRHNLANVLAALSLGRNVGLEWAPMLETLQRFSGLPHRCQLVRTLDGVRWYNDSKATNVGATVAAINGMSDEGPLVLIAGGVGKSADFSALSTAVSGTVRAVVLLGVDSDAIEAVIDEDQMCFRAADMEHAIRLARQQAEPGDCVLLSPACASFDMYDNYEQRGDHYAALVMELAS